MAIVLSESAAPDPVAEAARLFVEAAAFSDEPYTVERLQEMVEEIAILRENPLEVVQELWGKLRGASTVEEYQSQMEDALKQMREEVKGGISDVDRGKAIANLKSHTFYFKTGRLMSGENKMKLVRLADEFVRRGVEILESAKTNPKAKSPSWSQ